MGRPGVAIEFGSERKRHAAPRLEIFHLLGGQRLDVAVQKASVRGGVRLRGGGPSEGGGEGNMRQALGCSVGAAAGQEQGEEGGECFHGVSEVDGLPMVFVLPLGSYDCSHMHGSLSAATSVVPCATQPGAAFGLVPSLRQLAAGEALFREGSPTWGVFRLQSGGVRLVRCTVGGHQVATHTVRQGEFFAEAALFSETYHCDAVASEPSEVLVFHKDALVPQLRASPERLWTFSAELAKRVQGLRTRLEIQQTRSAEERILQFLHLHCDASGFWAQRGTLKHLAEEIGLTHEALYRALARLERQGLIVRKKAGLQLAR